MECLLIFSSFHCSSIHVARWMLPWILSILDSWEQNVTSAGATWDDGAAHLLEHHSHRISVRCCEMLEQWGATILQALDLPDLLTPLGMGCCRSTSNPFPIGSSCQRTATCWYQCCLVFTSQICCDANSSAVNRMLRPHSICCCGYQKPAR